MVVVLILARQTVQESHQQDAIANVCSKVHPVVWYAAL
jgi:hypothetical protein